ncbi:hypothetical protein NMG60_11017976 [Bertholletia excelsa]
MASAESRGTRSSNCEFEQGYTRKTPQGSYCTSSSSKSESKVMSKMPSIWESPNPYMPSETHWRPEMQRNSGHQEDLIYAQLNALELEVLSADFVDQIEKFKGQNSGGYVKNDCEPKIQELKDVINNNSKKVQNKEMGEFWFADDQLMGLPSFDVASDEPKKVSSDLESNWIGDEKNEPWWRTAHQDELASLVSYKSHEHFENCDLPQTQTERLARQPSASHDNQIVNSSSDHMANEGISNMGDCANGSPSSTLAHMFDKELRSTSSNNEVVNPNQVDEAEIPQRNGVDLSKTKLLEALCHSQTRAREAEKAAEQAYKEKEHIVMLFFRQASHLFAYRQWFQILQLENICLQFKNNDHQTCVHFPVFLPLVPCKCGQKRRNRQKAVKRKLKRSGNRMHKCAFAFAVGFGLASAGLFLGWSVGWFFPAF